MKQQQFVARHETLWSQLEQASEDGAQLPEHYRQLCQQLAVAQERHYSALLIERLNQLVFNCHQRLYAHSRSDRNNLLRFIAFEFPRAVRAERRLVILALLLFYLPGLLLWVGCALDDNLVYSVLPVSHIHEMEAMYEPGDGKMGRVREADSDLMMFGHYIRNNIGISFRTFAMGLIFGLGSAFYLVYNGVVIGAVFGHLQRIDYGQNFFPFVVGHGAFELTAIVLSGVAGLKLGLALLDPGQLTRLAALRKSAPQAIKIIYGTTAMLVLAAFIEAFWSPSTWVSAETKYIVGAACWTLVAVYFFFAGRRFEFRRD